MAEFNIGEEVLLKGTIINVDDNAHTYTIAVAEGKEVVLGTGTPLDKAYRANDGSGIGTGQPGSQAPQYTYGDVINVDGENLTITKQAVLKGAN